MHSGAFFTSPEIAKTGTTACDSPPLPNADPTLLFLQSCSYSHDGKLQPCKFLFGRGKCQHGSSCRFSHDTPSPEALAIVQEQWKNGGIKVAKETIESCELVAFDSFMTTSRYHLCSRLCARSRFILTHRRLDFVDGMWGLQAWEQFEKFPSRAVPATRLLSGNSATDGARDVSSKMPNSSHAPISSYSRLPKGNDALSAENAAAGALASDSKQGQKSSGLKAEAEQDQSIKQEDEKGDGSEFWS